ncbi:MAG: selenite/tellurite reduction operon rhodanese-like protein ExtH [Vicinamibacteria bacterium]
MRKTRTLAPLGALALLLTGAGCGDTAGTTGYDNPISTTSSGAIIDADTLADWRDEGKINAPLGNADRVVVVSVATAANFTSSTKRHIPEALLLDYPNELTMTREEGLGPVIQLMLSGSRMDALVQRLGIDANTTVVLTIPRGSTDLETYQQSVTYWTLRYWGFSRERVKILNGGDDAWDVAGLPLSDAIVSPTPSSYSVTANKVLKDALRTSVGEMLALVDSANKDRGVLETWQMLDVRGFGTSPYLANAYRGSSAMQFLSDRVGGVSTRNRLYPSREQLIARMASLPVLDGANSVFLSPTKKTLVMCFTSTSASPSFVLFDAVLAVPEGDVTMYDASATQWNSYSLAKIMAAGATAAQASAWAFDVPTPGTSLLRAVGPLPAAVAGENPFMPGNFIYSPAQPEMNQPEAADRAYMAATKGGGTSPGGGGGGTGGGC